MPEFAWWTARGLQGRFPSNSIGEQPWRRLVEDIENLRGGAPPEAYHSIFDRFLTSADSLRHRWPPHDECRLFISHRRNDVAEARDIAAIAKQEKYGYWLDVEDPVLQYANNSPIQSPAREILIASAIEIGLLNCSHVIGVMTSHTHGSKWVPYELGRAKQRMVYSRFSATWVDSQQTEHDCGEYIHLAVINRSHQEVRNWLRSSRCTTPEPGEEATCCRPPRDLDDPANALPDVPAELLAGR